MKKIKIKNDISIPGWGCVPAGTAFKVVRFNSRYVYVNMADGVELKLARKRDCEVVY